MPKTAWRTRFTVRGTLHFPHDMLRYDHCFPATPEDVQWIEKASQIGLREPIELMCETFTRTKAIGKPTNARWDSFSWPVTEVYPAERVAWDDIPQERRPRY